jgi:hypothetical protein
MEVKGKVVKMLPLQSGQGKNGEWKKQEFIVETEGTYPKKVCVAAWGEKIDQFDVSEGDSVNVSIEIESREFNGRWYTDVKAWKLQKEGGATGGAPSKKPAADADQGITTFNADEDDLPF